MRKRFIVAILSLIVTAGNTVLAQGNSAHQIRKEVEMEQINDQVVLTIKTIDGDAVTTEIYEGDAALVKLSELEKVDQKQIISSQEVKEEINIEEEGGVKTVTIKRTENGKTSDKIYTGVDAENKIKEIEERQNTPIKIIHAPKKEIE